MREERINFLATFAQLAIEVTVTSTITDRRDPNDNKFLALAVDGRADLIVTGDTDLLALNPYRGITITTPRDALVLLGDIGI